MVDGKAGLSASTCNPDGKAKINYMARKDITPKEDMDRPATGEEPLDEKHEKEHQSRGSDPVPESEKIRNAHATGLGAMGRSDQKLPDDDAGKPVEY
jgi:hypothetical protein